MLNNALHCAFGFVIIGLPSPKKTLSFLPGCVGFVRPSPSLWLVFCTCIDDSGTRFSPATTKNFSLIFYILEDFLLLWMNGINDTFYVSGIWRSLTGSCFWVCQHCQHVEEFLIRKLEVSRPVMMMNIHQNLLSPTLISYSI